ncbi:MAG: hypothetical protein QM214_01985 [Bacillota bacterium]|nr:hypothetical protein [Bacillota bacterium]
MSDSNKLLEELKKIDNEIINLEKQLFRIAPEAISTYMEIDSLWHRQQNLIEIY